MDKQFIFRHLKAWIALESSVYNAGDFHWVLKAPLFTLFLEEIDAVFPNSTYVFTNRDPLNVVPSTAGLVEAAASVKADWSNSRNMFNHVGKYIQARMKEFGDHELKFTSSAKAKNRNIVITRYPDVIKDPVAAVEEIYRASERELTDEAKK